MGRDGFAWHVGGQDRGIDGGIDTQELLPQQG